MSDITKYEKLAAEELLATITKEHKKIVLASSFGAEDQVLTHILKKVAPEVEIFTIDTGLLPLDTLKLKEKTESRYNFTYKVYAPSQEDVIDLIKEQGEQGFYDSLDKRKNCCYIRKIKPLERALTNIDGWITGLRREQSVTRVDTKKVETDVSHANILKINPLADWTEKDVWDYIKENGIPYNNLHDRGYPSIGCAPCTRAVTDGESVRDGRWWWENPEHKECGLHLPKNDNKDKKIQTISFGTIK